MRTQLTKEELTALLNNLEKELADKDQELRDMANTDYLNRQVRYLMGKVEVYERLMTLVEDYVKGEQYE